ncbi:MAG: hypothetical protein JXI43_05725, partial [Tissierellales bacterium]|nr:hypothetical protein [Tissierellales bacterium]
YLKPSGITMTLTGGNDTRMILAALLNLGIKPNTFTFGNPESLDAITARKVADSQKLKYQTHYIDNPDPSWLTRRGIEIIDKGNSLLNIHRAHRLDAIKREMESNSANEMIFVGDMGGEYTHGFSYTDYITSKLFRLWKQDDKAFNIELIKTLLKEGYFNEDKVNLDQIYTILCEQPFIHNKGKFGNFHVEYYLDAAVHHTQDMNLYLKNLKYLVCPFMDVDYLEVLFSSPYHMPLNEGDAKKNHIMEIWKPNLRLTVTHILAPELSDIEYGKKGYYSANEFFGNKFVILLKRIYRYKFKCKLTPTFAYRDWIPDFVRQSFNNLSEKTKYLLDMDLYQEDLLQTDHGTEEGYWHRFTNWINIDFIIKKYIKKNEKI